MQNTENNATRVITGKVRLSYAKIWKPEVGQDGGNPKYSTAILIPKSDTETVDKVKKAIAAAQVAYAAKIGKSKKQPLRDGDEEKSDDPNYANCYFLNASSTRRPDILNAALKPITDEDEVYSGCYCRVSLNFYGFDAGANKGIAAGLGNILKVADGEPLSGGARGADEFADIAKEIAASVEADGLL